MTFNWNADMKTAAWIGTDLTFRAATTGGAMLYLIRAHHLRGTSQRTGAEALSINLPRLRETLVQLADGARSGAMLTLD